MSTLVAEQSATSAALRGCGLRPLQMRQSLGGKVQDPLADAVVAPTEQHRRSWTTKMFYAQVVPVFGRTVLDLRHRQADELQEREGPDCEFGCRCVASMRPERVADAGVAPADAGYQLRASYSGVTDVRRLVVRHGTHVGHLRRTEHVRCRVRPDTDVDALADEVVDQRADELTTCPRDPASWRDCVEWNTTVAGGRS